MTKKISHEPVTVVDPVEPAGDPCLRDLDALCRQQYPRLLGMLGLYCADRDLAEELTQETLARLCRHWPQLEPTEHIEHWLTRVAFNLAKSRFRSRSTHQHVIERYGHSMSAPVDLGDPTDAVAVRAAVARLPERQRRALILRYFADLPVTEVAALMDCPQGTIKTLTFQAIASLRRMGLDVTDD